MAMHQSQERDRISRSNADGAESKCDEDAQITILSHQFFDNLDREFLSTEEAAQYLRTTVGSVRNATSNGKIPPRCYGRLGKRILYIKSELRKLLLGQDQKGES